MHSLLVVLLSMSAAASYMFGPGWTVPSCLQNSCTSSAISAWSAGDICNATSTATLNACIAASSCSPADRQSAYSAIASACADAGYSLTAAPEATFSASSTTAAGPFGPFGGYGGGGWGPFASGSMSWPSSGAWTEWWGGSDCPPSTWTGWTAGPWSTDAPWTSWTACTQTTTADVVTSTVSSGSTVALVTSTAVQVKVGEATATASSAAGGRRAVAAVGGVVGGVAFAVALV